MEQTDLYIKVKQYITKCIYEGVYMEHEKIPSERVLAEELGVSRVTIRKSLDILEKQHLLSREVGSGTRIHFRNKGHKESLDMITLVAPARNPFFSEFIENLQQVLEQKEILLLYVQKPEQERLEDCLFRLSQRGLHNAVVWLDDAIVDMEKIKRLRAIGMNMVFFDTNIEKPYADSVFLDNEHAIEELMDNLIKRNRKDLIYIGWNNNQIFSVRKRQEAYQKYQEKREYSKIQLMIPWEKRGKIDVFVKEMIKDLLGKEKILDAQTGIICGDGEIGIAVGKVLKKLQRREIAIASVDEFARSKDYQITTIMQDFGETTKKVYESMVKQSDESREWQPTAVKIRGKINQRQSI